MRSFSGPLFSPATRNAVLELIDEAAFPPWAAIVSFILSRLIEKLPEITMLLPSSASDRRPGPESGPVSKRSPASRRRRTSCMFASEAKKSSMLPAMTSPTSPTSSSCSLSAPARASMLPKCRARVRAVVSPTYLMPSANSTLSKGTPRDCSRLARNFCTERSCQPGSPSSW